MTMFTKKKKKIYMTMIEGLIMGLVCNFGLVSLGIGFIFGGVINWAGIGLDSPGLRVLILSNQGWKWERFYPSLTGIVDDMIKVSL